MTLPPIDWREIPADTTELGRKLLDEHNPYRLVGDQLSGLMGEEDYADLYAPIGGPAISPVVLSLVSVFQMLENLSDRQAAEILPMRIDWKYALHLPLEYAGFSFTNLSHFRTRLLAHQAEYRVFDHLVKKLGELGLIRQRGKQRSDSTHILGLIAKLNRLELVEETLRMAVHALLRQNETWVQEQLPDSFVQAHQQQRRDYRMSEAQRKTLLEQTGADGWWLLQQLARAPQDLQGLAEVQTLRSVWEQQFAVDEQNHYQGPRQKVTGSGLIQSPHDPEVRYSEKAGRSWQGYKGQLSETAEDQGQINFITDVAVTDAQLQDVNALPAIQARLAERQLTPAEQYVDHAYVSTQRLADSQSLGTALMGPIKPPPEGPYFPLEAFRIDLEAQQAYCPGGQGSQRAWQTHYEDGALVYRFSFGSHCPPCPLRSQCTSSQEGRTLSYQQHHELLLARQAEMQTETFWQSMKARPPVEGTLSQMVRLGARRARYRGLRKVNFQWVFTAIAINLKRLCGAWARNYQPSWGRPMSASAA